MIRESKQSDIPRIAETAVFSKRMALHLILRDDKFCFENISVVGSIVELKKPNALKDLFVYDDGIIKGFIKFKKSNNSIEITDIYVDPFFQQNGIGRDLVSFTENFAKEKGISTLKLYLYTENSGTVEFFETLGFSESGEKKASDELKLELSEFCKTI